MLKNIAIFGATGLVGLELIKILEQRNFELNSLKLFASKKSAGQKLEFKNQELEIFELTEDIFDNFELDLIFCCLSNSLAKKFMPLAQAKNIICIDKSSHFRLDPKVPLVAYEVNKNSIHNNKIIASPNCTTTPLVQVLNILKQIAPLKRVIVSSYQAISGAGANPNFGKEIKNNCLAYIEGEEEKIALETKKILNLPDLKISATCVRIPVQNCHSLSVNIEFEQSFDLDKLIQKLKSDTNQTALKIYDMPGFPTPLETTGKDFTGVGRIRVDPSVPFGLSLFIVSDNLRTGAALNSVKIAEYVCKD